MTEKQVLESLCYYDKRNPDHIDTEIEENTRWSGRCYCDNCFRGKTKLAEYILELYKVIEHHKNARGL